MKSVRFREMPPRVGEIEAIVCVAFFGDEFFVEGVVRVTPRSGSVEIEEPLASRLRDGLSPEEVRHGIALAVALAARSAWGII